MLAKSIELEKFRQKLEKVENELGSLSDYLDRGKPNGQQTKQTNSNIAQLENQRKELRAQFHDLLVAVRASEPQAIEQWVQWHLDICQRIIAEPADNAHKKTRQSVAKGTLTQWNKVKQGEQEVVLLNWYYLADYSKEAQKSFGGQGNTWWKFWK